MTDVTTQLKLVNGHLRLALEQVSDGVVIVRLGDQKPRAVLANRSLLMLTELTEDQLVGGGIDSFIHADDMQVLAELFRRGGSSPVPVPQDIRLLTTSGVARVCAATASVARDEKGKALSCTLTFRERRRWDPAQDLVAEPKEAVEATGTNVELSERVERCRMETLALMAGGIAHDFNNILTGITANLSMARPLVDAQPAPRSTQNEELGLGDYILHASKAAVGAQALAKRLLAFARGGKPQKDNLDIGELLQESIDISTYGSNVRCEYHRDAALWGAVIDPIQVIQLFNNLIINAWQAMPEGGVIQLRAENREVGAGFEVPEGRYVLVTVRDRGCGIPQSDLKRIFEHYYTTKPEGSGWGLATCNSVVEEHGGCIEVDSMVGHGTSFRIYLPASAEKGGAGFLAERKPRGAVVASPAPVVTEQPQDEMPVPAEQRPAALAAPAAPCPILVVDDQDSLRHVIKMILKRIGHPVLEAATGDEAVQVYRTRWLEGDPIGLVIMDMTLPGGMDGEEATREIVQIDPLATVLLSSGFIDQDEASLKAKGFSGALPKPYEYEDVEAAIKEHLGDSGSPNAGSVAA